MEKEINIDREKIVTYCTWHGFIGAILIIPLFGLGLIMLVVQGAFSECEEVAYHGGLRWKQW